MMRWMILGVMLLPALLRAAPEATVRAVLLDTYTLQQDFNSNGAADIFEDVNHNGLFDVLEDFNHNGRGDALEDFNGNGVADALEDVNGNSIPDGFEDVNRDGVCDAFADENQNGLPDGFEMKYDSISYDAASGCYGPMHIRVMRPDGALVLGDHIYHGMVYRLDWSDYMAAHADMAGVVYRVDQNPTSSVAVGAGAYAGRSGPAHGDIKLKGDGCYYVHIAPVKAKEFEVHRGAETTILIRCDTRGPRVHSVSHEDQDRWYAIRRVSLELLPFHLDRNSVNGFYFEWDQHRYTEPTKQSPFLTDFRTQYPAVTDGIHYFHVRSEDLAGGLSATTHYRVQIGACPQPEADFFTDTVEGKVPLTVQFVNRSKHEIDAYVWDFENDGVVDSSAKDPLYVYRKPGVYSVKLMLVGPGGLDSIVKEHFITVRP